MRQKLIAGNWKMNKTVKEAAATVEAFALLVEARSDVDVVVCPPFLAIPKVHDLLRDSKVKLGAQDVFWAEKGAFTGKISAGMLKDQGVEFCIVGHSETRGRFGKLEVPESTIFHFAETDETINLKIRSLLYHSITPILCVGESEKERDNGNTDSVIAGQLDGALKEIDPSELFQFAIAYEPVWAIGTGKVCDTDEAERVCGLIRELLRFRDADLADSVRVLYGGSVKSSNARELLAMSNIDGALVGGASLDPDEFGEIVKRA